MGSASTNSPTPCCYLIKCIRCGKLSWAGCGLHVGDLLDKIPWELKCHCCSASSRRRE
ncbi:hypothetical protein PTTG_29246 [Puccinia triticina 1-1 BBBD Race 1]|uniref:Uncharacterized protein n=1 Tax=Puccinia triticina (isolate 1-1 / race 1 (BBBD)) TaxID=630390 RepID=A0A180G7K4_PUCT1|nr:hypothetical protein PTTG_29246 [Puccinia triticina 1-1 BBBD Race 1]